MARLGDEIGQLLPAALASLGFGEDLLLMGRCGDVSLTSIAWASSPAALLTAGEHLLLVRRRG